MKLKLINILIISIVFSGCSSIEQALGISSNKNDISHSYEYGSTNYNVNNINEIAIVNNESNSSINEDSNKTKELRNKDVIGVVLPSSTIGKYAIEAVNSINTYLLYKKISHKIIVYDMQLQNKANMIDIFDKLHDDNITKAIVMVTKQSLKILNDIDKINNIKVFLPLINKEDISDNDIYDKLNVVFGAISYKDQFEKLISYSKDSKLVDFYDNSEIGYTLHNYLKDYNIKYKKKINDNNGMYKNFLENNGRLTHSSVILNTPIVKSSMLLSAIAGAENIFVSNILSTQLNYTPLIFKLTQKPDRKKLIVANSIGKLPKYLEEYNTLMGNNILYSWVNYATIVGFEYLVSNNIDLFTDLKIIDNQVKYPVQLYRVGNNSFSLIP